MQKSILKVTIELVIRHLYNQKVRKAFVRNFVRNFVNSTLLWIPIKKCTFKNKNTIMIFSNLQFVCYWTSCTRHLCKKITIMSSHRCLILRSVEKKHIIILATSGLYSKCFTLIIYDRNDIGLYYKTRDDRNWWS